MSTNQTQTSVDDTIAVTDELDAANARLAYDTSQAVLPLPYQLRVIALTIAQRHMGDATVKEGALYNALKMDNKPIDPLTVDHVIRAALVMERYLWGQWSAGLAQDAMETSLKELEAATKARTGLVDPEAEDAPEEPPDELPETPPAASGPQG